jgi:hypothetical protein
MSLRRVNPLRKRLRDITKKLRGSIPPTLYHYTSAAGLKGIIENSQLWASNARYLNDSTEVLLGIEHLSDILTSEQRRQVAAKRIALLDTLLDWIKTLERVADRVYAVCFCEKDDLLGQWRGYANMGGGYCIGFDPKEIDTRRERKLEPRLRKVIYTEDEQLSAIHEILQAVYEWVDALGRRGSEQQIAEAADDAIIEFFGLLPTFKDKSFAQEEEWRLIYTPRVEWLAKHLQFIDYGAWLKPYVQCRPWRTSRPPIISVTCGPSLNPQLGVAAVRLLLQRSGILPMIPTPQDFSIKQSEVPFRYSH